jgi:hypothetical protein
VERCLLLALLLVGTLTASAQTYEQRALRISREILTRHLPFGTVIDPMYTAPDSSQIQTYTRCGDSAIWTGHWLAAESFRYAVNPTPSALAAVKTALSGIQSLVDVTGSHNLLARCILDPSSPWSAGPRNEERHHREWSGTWNGREYIWIGNTSRDQYLGVFFGLSVAYQQVNDSEVRETIAQVATRLIDRLLQTNWAVFMPDGAISTVFWFRPEQTLAILQVGRQVNPVRFGPIYEEARRGAHGLGLIIWLESLDPHNSYFKFNLDAITLYMLLNLEEPGRARTEEYLDAYQIFRETVGGHGNAFFNMIDRAIAGPDSLRDLETRQLMAEWLQRPRRDLWVDLRGKYPACGEDRACDPIPVPERVRTDFLWQRSPFLLYGGGEGRIEGAGIDFILPHWMARYYGVELGG